MAKTVRKKKKSRAYKRTRFVFWTVFILFITPFVILGYILLSAAGDTGKPILGNRYEGDLNPAIAEDQWAGLTLDELRQRRARALVRREVERVKMDHVLQGARTRVSENGVRALMFKDKTIGRLKTADYLFLGFRLTRSLMKLWRKK